MHTSADTPADLTALKQLVTAAEAQATTFGCRNAGMLVDNLLVLHGKPAFVALQSAMTSSWVVAVSNLDALATTDMQKAIVLCSSWAIPESSFPPFLKAVVERVEQGMLDRNLLYWCQNPFESPLAGFLVRRHAEPAVQEVIVRSRSVFRDMPDRVAVYDEMLTGESRRKLEHFEATSTAASPAEVAVTTQGPEAPDVTRSSFTKAAEKHATTPSAPPSASNSLPVLPVERPTGISKGTGSTFLLLVIGCAVMTCGVIVWLCCRR